MIGFVSIVTLSIKQPMEKIDTRDVVGVGVGVGVRIGLDLEVERLDG